MSIHQNLFISNICPKNPFLVGQQLRAAGGLVLIRSDWMVFNNTSTLSPSLSLCCCGLAGSPSVTQAACYFRHTDPGLGWGMYSCLTYGWNQILISNNASPPIWHSPSHPRGEGAAELSQSTVSVLKASNHFQSEINTLLILRVLPRNFQCSGALSV